MENSEYMKEQLQEILLGKEEGLDVSAYSNIVEFRNLESEQHIKRIREFTLCLGTSVMELYPEYGLTEDEYEVIKSHTAKGAEIIERVIRIDSRVFRDYAYDIARHHHEKYDGNGYPDGLKGEEISIAAQIVSLVDVYDALTSKRVYKAAYKEDKAFQMIINGQSGAFSSKLLKAFTEVRMEFEDIVKKYRDE